MSANQVGRPPDPDRLFGSGTLSSAGPGGSELNHPVAPLSEGMRRRSNTVA